MVELAVASAVLMIVLALFLDALVSLQGTLVKTADRSDANDAVRLAMQDLDRQVRSGNILHDPATESIDPADPVPAGFALRIYTQANAPTRSPGNQCVQWRVHGGRLQTRRWSNEWRTDGVVTGWRTVAERMANEDEGVVPFVLDGDPAFGERMLRVSLMVQPRAKNGAAVRIDASLTGRNTQFGYPNSVCNDIPEA